MIVHKGSHRIFSDKEILDIDEYWNPELIVNKDYLDGRAYDNIVVKNKHFISKLPMWH